MNKNIKLDIKNKVQQAIIRSVVKTELTKKGSSD